MPRRNSHFTGPATEALILAQTEAARFQQPAVAPEHIFLGLLGERTGSGRTLVGEHVHDLDEVQLRIEQSLPHGVSTAPPSGMTPEATAIMNDAVRVAKQFHRTWIGLEHILIAMLEAPGPIHASLYAVGLTAGMVRDMFVPGPSTPAQALSRAQVAAHLAANAASREPVLEGSAMAGGIKRYNLALPQALFDQVEAIAAREGTSVLEVLRRGVKLALLVDDSQRRGARLLIRDGDLERELILL